MRNKYYLVHTDYPMFTYWETNKPVPVVAHISDNGIAQCWDSSAEPEYYSRYWTHNGNRTEAYCLLKNLSESDLIILTLQGHVVKCKKINLSKKIKQKIWKATQR